MIEDDRTLAKRVRHPSQKPMRPRIRRQRELLTELGVAQRLMHRTVVASGRISVESETNRTIIAPSSSSIPSPIDVSGVADDLELLAPASP